MVKKMSSNKKVTILLVILVAIILIYSGSSAIQLPIEFSDSKAVVAWVKKFGIWGPILIIGLIAAAIVISPIPSAPIALASGAAYGHGWGTLYVLAGSSLGALIAFSISRTLGFDFIERRFGKQFSSGLLGSQNFVMWTVFVSRLMPFISFDIISYAAGLTSISITRFLLATIVGITPASFMLAHLGGELMNSESTRFMIAILFVGLVTAASILIKLWLSKNNSNPNVE